MSAYFVKLTAHEAVVYSDAAYVESENYTVCQITRKCLAIPGLPLVITGRGEINLLMEMGNKLLEFSKNSTTVDDVIDAFADYLVRLETEIRHYAFIQDFMIAGNSESDGPFAFLVIVGNEKHKAETFLNGFEFFTMNAVERISCGGPFNEIEFGDAGFSEKQFHKDVIEADVVKLFQSWRQKAVFAPNGDNPLFGIGGQLHKTTITKEGVKFEALGYWPDMIGENIRPDVELVLV